MKPRPGDGISSDWLIAELALLPPYHRGTIQIPILTQRPVVHRRRRVVRAAHRCNAHNHRRRVCTRCRGCPISNAQMAAPPLPAAPPYATPAPAAFELAAPESSLLLVHLDRAIKGERAQALDEVRRARLEQARATALLEAEAARGAAARADAKAADQRREKAEADAEALRAQLADAEARHRAARDAWALKEKKLRAAAAPRDEPPATILDRLVDAVARRPDAEAEELEAWASRARQFQRAVEERIRDTGATPRPPTAAEPPTPAKTAEPSSLQDTYAAGQTIPGDEMEKLLLQYTRAKEKLSTLERLYPGGE